MAEAAARSVLISQIGTLALVPPGPVPGARMAEVPMLHNAAMLLRDGRIAWFGPEREIPLEEGATLISALGGTVIPGLIDPHTHIPFAGDRSGEFMQRLSGETYLSILEGGGGIRSTCRAVRSATLEELVAENLPRLQRMLEYGVTRVECKSGYGLTPEDELKQLDAIRELGRLQPIDLTPTYLGAHAVPEEFDGRPDEYIETIGSPALLGEIAERGLARFCDVFCDRGAFDVTQARRLLVRAREAGLQLKIHADELAQIGASKLAGELGAVSADHLELIGDDGIAALQSSGTIPIVLPGTSFFLGISPCNARRLIQAGLPMALATDFNPGSCMIESLPLIMNIACCQLRLLPAEVLVACTANAAAALDVQRHAGAIEVGFDADLVVLDAPSLEAWFYKPGRPRVRAVIKGGHVVWRRPDHGLATV
ncbi:MAG: imidazolonepropionase [Planctomycetota bacterium]